MLKMMIVGRRRGGMTLAQLHRYMVDVHGAMVLRHISTSPELTPKRYVQNHVFDSSTRMPLGRTDPFAGSRDFVTQVWFDSPAQAAAAVQAPLYLNELQPDEDNFVDQPSVVKLPVVPQPVRELGASDGASKLFVFHRRASGVSVDVLAAATFELWRPLLVDSRHAIAGLVRNMVLPSLGGTVDIVDEAWLSDDGAARRLGEQWQSLADQLVSAKLLEPGSSTMMLAREVVLHAHQAIG